MYVTDIFYDKLEVTFMYRNKPKYWDRHAYANSVDPDEMPQNAASRQGLHYLPFT